MKYCKLIILSTILFYSCNGDRDNYDLSHHYEPHVAIRHSGDNTDQHYYSVMLVVKKGTKVYAEKSSDNPNYALKYSFDKPQGTEQVASKKYSLNSEYEVRFYEYPIDLSTKEAANSTDFWAVVVEPPKSHSHQDPVPLHKGTIHKPGGGSEE